MTGHRLLPSVEGRLRVAPWRGDDAVAYLTPGRRQPDSASIDRCLAELADRGIGSAFTAALAPDDQRPFLLSGFTVHERLHLLTRTLEDLPDPKSTGAVLRRGRHRDRSALLAVDEMAFPPFWHLDSAGLDDALAATPSARLRVAVTAGDQTLIGYAVTGRAGHRGYLQRLAVDPRQQRDGIGTALVVDGLRWLKRWGAQEVLVNTQEGNEAAVRLYEHLGFRRQPGGLAVLHWSGSEAP